MRARPAPMAVGSLKPHLSCPAEVLAHVQLNPTPWGWGDVRPGASNRTPDSAAQRITQERPRVGVP